MGASDVSLPGERAHLVQFYDADVHLLIANVGRYLAEGLLRGEGIVVIATSQHREAFQEELNRHGVEPEQACSRGLAVFRDAEETLSQVMVGCEPSSQHFERTVGAIPGSLRERVGPRHIRAYGEMVNLLWNAGYPGPAVRLEQYWNRLIAAGDMSLFCAYQIDVFGKEFRPGVLDGILRAHTHLVPLEPDSALSAAVDRATMECIGPELAGRDSGQEPSSQWAAMPQVQSKLLWLRDRFPEHAEQVLARARQYYHAAIGRTAN